MPKSSKTSKEKGGIELRRGDRVPVGNEVKLSYDNLKSFKTDYAENISEGGMFVRTDHPAPVNTTVHFQLEIREIQKKISGNALVVWTKEFLDHPSHRNNPDHRASGMGLKFIKLEGDSLKFIREFVESNPIDYPEEN